MSIKNYHGIFRVECDRCGEPAPCEFVSVEDAEEWLDGSTDAPECNECNGTGEVDHECDCKHCCEMYDECETCNGLGTLKPLPPVGKIFHATTIGTHYCPKCVDLIISERKAEAAKS